MTVATSCNPKSPYAYIQLGILSTQKKEFNDAISYFEKAVRYDQLNLNSL